MTIVGTFMAHRDINPERIVKVFIEFASSEKDLQRAKKGKEAQFTSENLTIADISSRLSKIGRIYDHNIVA